MIELVRGLLDAMKPIPLMKVSEWADKNRRLTSESAAEPGRWSTDRTPYLREIMDNLSPNSPVNEVGVVKGVQLGFTESGLNMAGCYMDLDPCPIMYVMPTIEMSKAISESRVDPMIENSPSLQKKVRPNKERDAGNTKFVKRFPGGLLVMSGANSAASLRSRPVKVLILDEVDAYPLSVDKEGSPIALAEKRTSTFGAKRKIYKLSTPTIEGVSVIQKGFDVSEQRRFFVPCPHCGDYQHLQFSQMKWEQGKPESVRYACEHCGTLIEERYKTSMMAHGEWRPTIPAALHPLKRFYHINSLYSPLGWLSWTDIIQQLEDAGEDDNLLMVWTNTILGETWKERGESPPWESLYNRRETYAQNRPPAEVCFLTAGVDIQKDRIELEVVGWAKGKRSFSVDYRVILGRTSEQAVWDELAKVVSETWTRADGLQLQLSMMAVDSGYNTQEVYSFCRAMGFHRVIPTKGNPKQAMVVANPRAVHTMRNGKKTNDVKVWNVGVSIVKSELYGWLGLQKEEDGTTPAGYCSFPQYDQHYFKMLTSEKNTLVLDKKGFQRYEWVLPSGNRNEALDCRVYARAAAAVVGIDRFTDADFDAMAGTYKQEAPKKTAQKKPSFWDKNGR
jgi:phage terminase large subunit GpA-like protein